VQIKIRSVRRALATVGASSVLLLAIPATPALALDPPIAPFPTCPNLGYQVQTQAGLGSTIGNFDLNTSTFVPIKKLPVLVNAIGYSTTQNVFWGMDVSTVGADKIVRIDSQGNLDYDLPPNNTGPVAPPAQLTVVTGAVNENLLYLHTKTPSNHLIIIDVNPTSPTLGGVLADVPLSRTTPGQAFLNIGDWDFNPVDNQLYSLEWQNTVRRTLVRVNPLTGVITNVWDLTSKIPDGQNFGADYVERGDNIMYVSNNDVNRTQTQSQTFSIDITTGDVLAYTPGAWLTINDGAGCLLPTDFGDAPQTFKTLNTDQGPGHVITSALHRGTQLTIGAAVDPDLDGIPSPLADGDDKNRGIDDEDGFQPGSAVSATAPRLTIPCVNTTGATATLAGWIDRNRDGSFQAAERAMATVPAGATSATLIWPVQPALLAAAVTPLADQSSFLRLRLYPGVVANPLAVGAEFIMGGEIEDHPIILRTPVGDEPSPAPSTPGVPPGANPPVANPPGLPQTGQQVAALIGTGLMLIAGGLLTLFISRRVARRS
jgi:LPXTG-motif cell wall-anchored protein